MARRSRGKSVDRWKSKIIYDVIAPELFKNKVVGKIAADEDSKLLNRIIKIGMKDMTGSYDELNMYTTIRLKIVDVKGRHANTKLTGHELSRAYIRTLAARRRSIVDPVVDVITKNNIPIRVKSLIVTRHRISSSQKTALRKLFSAEITAFASDKSFNDVMSDLLFGRFSAEFAKKARKIVPIRTVKIRKTEVKHAAV